MKIVVRSVFLWLMFVLQVSAADAGELIYRHGFSFVNDQRYPPDFTHFEYLNPDAPKGGTLVMSTALDINNFSDEWDNAVDVAPGLTDIYDFLLIRADDELSGYYGRLAQGIAVADDLLSISFRLHPHARWHDGRPLTAHDVKFTFDYAMTTIDGSLFMNWLESTEVLGDHENLFRLTEELTTTHLALFSYNRILPAHYWKGRDPSKTTLVPPPGSGPYRVADFEQGRFVRYERVRDYWGKDLPVNRGRFNFDEIRFDVYRDSTVAREALRKGLFDVWFEGDPRHWVSSYDTPARENGWLVLTGAPNGMYIGPAVVLAFNVRRPPFDDPLVREALTNAMDYGWLNRVLNHGLYQQSPSYFTNSVFASSGLPDKNELELLEPFRDRIPPRVFTHSFNNPRSTGYGRNREALLRARELLAEAGWRIRDGILANADGEPFELEFLSQYPEEKRILLPYIEALKKLGIDARIRLVESAQLIYRRRSYDFDAMIHAYQLMVPPDLQATYYLHSSAANSPVTGNVAGITDPVVDFLIAKVGMASTLDDMVASSRALDRVLLWNFYNVPLRAFSDLRIVHWDKFGRADLDYEPLNQSVFPQGWWYDEAKAARIPETN